MDERCRREIEELHELFEGWFTGRLPDTDLAFSRLAVVLAPDFELVSPSGELAGRGELLERIRAAHGSRPPRQGPYRIWTCAYRGRSLGVGLHLAVYEEWQERDDGERGRLSTALFRENPSAPNGVEWVHVHETWLPTPPGVRG